MSIASVWLFILAVLCSPLPPETPLLFIGTWETSSGTLTGSVLVEELCGSPACLHSRAESQLATCKSLISLFIWNQMLILP